MILFKILAAFRRIGFRATSRLIVARVIDLFEILTKRSRAGFYFYARKERPELFLDVSEISAVDWGTGIQRVTRSIVRELVTMNTEPYKVTLVYATDSSAGYREANFCINNGTGEVTIARSSSRKSAIKIAPGDIFIGLDWVPHVVSAQRSFYDAIMAHGVRVYFLLHDLLPISYPNFFPTGSYDRHITWLRGILRSNGIVSVSRSSMDRLREWMLENDIRVGDDFLMAVSHNGADVPSNVGANTSTKTRPLEFGSIRPLRFLMVGTIEPRKGHQQIIEAFQLLWGQGENVELVIVGKEGWNVDALINDMKELARSSSLFAYEKHVDDERLVELYRSADCLIAASYDEGFGLPLIEAAQFNLPLLARDIPVFREVAGNGAYFFDAQSGPVDISVTIRSWIRLFVAGEHPSPAEISWKTWGESAQCLFELVTDESRL